MPLAGDVNLDEIAVATQNYTGADLSALCREAVVNAMENDSKKINSKNFALALKKIRPSITKEMDQWYTSIKDQVSNIIPRSSDKTFYG